MKKFLKIFLFFIVFIILFIIFSYLCLPKYNLHKYGMYNTSMYEILGEKENTIDTIVLGDSLVYSSVSPMEIYDKYGFTVFDCSEPAIILPDAYNYFKVAVESQHPSVVIVEPNMFFRNSEKRPWYNKPLKILKNSFPLFTYHNNWKKLFFKDDNGWINIGKGYKKNTKVKPTRNYNYMDEEKTSIHNIPSANYKYIKAIISYCKKHNIKLIFMGLPSQKSWDYNKHVKIKKLADENNITYVNLNFPHIISFNWKKESKDRGSHLNDVGARKNSEYVGNYLKRLNLVKSHKNEKGYEDWDKALELYLKN